MKRNGILAIICTMMLLGCSPSTDEPKAGHLYDGLSARQTYAKVVKKMNDDVSYYRCVENDNGNITNVETYKINNEFCFVNKALFEEGAYNTLYYTITQDTNFHTLYLGADDQYVYSVINDYPNEVKQIYKNYMEDEHYKVYDIQRDKHDDKLVLTLKMAVTEEFGMGNEAPSTETRYALNEMTIDDEGYISQEKITYYQTEKFKDVLREGKILDNSNFNDKDKKDFDEEIRLMASCNGLDDQTVKEKLQLTK